ncbi:MAG: transcriptional regulator [Deltaproteobacteria bacterium]|nr:transcriptional regulator [Deltaproteobacteria bacterium]MBM4285153.1 transcriptional regulator [Deltaproteobacteria bacterium]
MGELLKQLQEWIKDRESEHLEFKEAKVRYDFEELTRYCAAIANEGGGKIILGISHKRPRKVVGTSAFNDLERTKAGLIERLHLRVEVDEISHPDGRVLVFNVPSRPLGMAIQFKGAYWMRGGEDLVPMTPDLLKRIFAETGPDFSAEISPKATMADLDTRAIDNFRRRWLRKSENPALENLSTEQLLTDAELILDGNITYAALILFGSRQALGKYLGQAEVIFEYRSSEASIPCQQREEYRLGFFQFMDDIWNKVNLRNEMQHFEDGLFIWDIPTFNEVVVREAILNAVAHRDYRLPGSTFVKQFPRKMEIVSPGGFPPGITPENILWKQMPRNRRIAEVLAKCGLVERSGQGVNRMFEECIKESKPWPSFAGSDDYQVVVTLRGEVQDPQFLRFLEKVGKEKLASFTTMDFLILDLINREEPIPAQLRPRLPHLVDHGVVEKVGRGKGVRHIIARQFYRFLGKKGVYTRKRGLDRETNKMLLFKHIQDNRKEGSRLQELMQVLPACSRGQIQGLLKELEKEGRVHHVGATRGALWFPR